ncbi:hypothetical protein DICPUDRAFT_73841 [Dictyostelium purpureum]|uniref:Auto-transporter adhesin head GIN domain-containing protein n=1 Tax=Dictyostelium purpureum TaxID=5786 RepID=F0Z613_DICPU|nr:uncharacterized protein DICPUDRAFT_73841 [Dictyostelium purpureum]EGC40519.1 hypothetical protein DICPUDRAFT_73841 [Dictyostelium purpureum]|eukprot:XP_003282855.1 hypothetical protein DICPUDRAFT_73841 [Dictyostelium purpureum]
MKYNYIFLTVFLLLNFNNIIAQIVFNNNIINTCTNDNPCDLSSKEVWTNNQVPLTNDDVVIDFSSVESTSNIYLVAQNFHISLNSFNITGPSSSPSITNLLINNSNLTVSVFTMSNLNVTIDGTKGIVYNLGNFKSYNTNLLVQGNGYINVTQTEILGEIPANFIGNVSFVSNGPASLQAPMNWSSQIGLLEFNGAVEITGPFNIASPIAFYQWVEISSNGTMNQVFFSDYFTIEGGSSVHIDQIDSLLSGSLVNVIEQSSLYLATQPFSPLNFFTIEDRSTLYLPSGGLINDLFRTGNGTLVITDSKKVTTFYLYQPYLSVTSLGSLELIGNLDTVTVTGQNSNVTLENVSNVNSISVNGLIFIDIAGSLTVSQQALAKNVLVSGSLTLYGGISSNRLDVTIFSSLIISNNSYVDSSVNSYGRTTIDSGCKIKSIVQKAGSTLAITSPGISILDGFTMVNGSYTTIQNASINNNEPIIKVNQFNLNNTQFDIQLIQGSNPADNDTILIVQSSDLANSNNIFEQTSIIIRINSQTRYTALNYKIESDSNGNVRAIFYKEKKPTNYTGVIIGTIFGGAVLIAIVVTILCCVSKRKKSHHHYHQHERKSLIHN